MPRGGQLADGYGRRPLAGGGGLGGVHLGAQLIGTALGVTWALVGGLLVYGGLRAFMGLRLSRNTTAPTCRFT